MGNPLTAWKRTVWPDEHTQRLAAVAIYTALAAIIGFLESLFPLPFLSALPGVKLGFANIVTVWVAKIYGKKAAGCVALLRPFLTVLFTGNPVSLALSLSGGILAFGVLCLLFNGVGNTYTYIALSALSAVGHAVGQLLAATILMATDGLWGYFPLLALCSLLTGCITGGILNALFGRKGRW